MLTVTYGVLHDQITARVCVEYFTVAHLPLVDSGSPTVLGLYWGVYASWKFGVVLGIAAALLSQVGSWPRLTLAELCTPLGVFVLLLAMASFVCGVLAYGLALVGWLTLGEPMATEIAISRHSVFLADRWAHLAAHFVGIVGGGIICSGIWLVRKRWAEANSRATRSTQ